MKKVKLILASVLITLSLNAFCLADGDTPIGNRDGGDTPIGNVTNEPTTTNSDAGVLDSLLKLLIG